MSDQPSSSGTRAVKRMSLHTASLFRSALNTGAWLRRALWVWPMIAAVLLGAIGLFLRLAMEENLKHEMVETLETILKADVAALQMWWRNEEAAARSVAANSTVESLVERLVAKAAPADVTQLDLLQSDELKGLREELTPICEANGYNGWILVDRRPKIIGALRNELINLDVPKEDHKYAARVLEGTPTVTPPRKSLTMLPGRDGELKSGQPTMFVFAPVRSGSGEVIAALGFRINPEEEFTEILGIARPGNTGETYAITQDSRMVSTSRFDEQLHQLGLLSEDQNSILNLTIRDPGVDLTRNQRLQTPRSELPPTRPAAAIAAGKSGIDVSGYRDYRGVMNVGAWVWLPDYEIGIITEQDADEAYAVLSILRAVFWSLFALLGAAALAIFIGMLVLQRKNREAQNTALKLRQLGQYTLDEKLGEGGMGVVYRGHHAMLHRPTAVKFLDVQKTNSATIARFEREVQLTARLTHPNTIAVYDYGRTPEGIFYYAMEYLEGIDLEHLIEKFGSLPEGRVIHILQQVCGSLAEAHGIGLIHRDVKPANIFLTSRGGLMDFVKLLDFGLVRALDEKQNTRLTSAGTMTGTPLYLSPEAIQSPDTMDARSDLYAVGAVGYFLLTGTPVFDGRNVVEIVQHHLQTTPESPSKRLEKQVSRDLEQVLLRCLKKDPAERPQSALDLVRELLACRSAAEWQQKHAAEWWEQTYSNGSGKTKKLSTTLLGATMISGADSPTAS